jgi:hypothetical protein
MTLFNIVGALLAAMALSLPLGLVVRSKPLAAGAVVSSIVVVTTELLAYPLELPGFLLAMHAIELLSFVGACALMTQLISRLRARWPNPSFNGTPGGAR